MSDDERRGGGFPPERQPGLTTLFIDEMDEVLAELAAVRAAQDPATARRPVLVLRYLDADTGSGEPQIRGTQDPEADGPAETRE